jgi:hypothetical protein
MLAPEGLLPAGHLCLSNTQGLRRKLAEESAVIRRELSDVPEAPAARDVGNGCARAGAVKLSPQAVQSDRLEMGLRRHPEASAEGVSKRALAGTADLAQVRDSRSTAGLGLDELERASQGLLSMRRARLGTGLAELRCQVEQRGGKLVIQGLSNSGAGRRLRMLLDVRGDPFELAAQCSCPRGAQSNGSGRCPQPCDGSDRSRFSQLLETVIRNREGVYFEAASSRAGLEVPARGRIASV